MIGSNPLKGFFSSFEGMSLGESKGGVVVLYAFMICLYGRGGGGSIVWVRVFLDVGFDGGLDIILIVFGNVLNRN